MDYNIIYHPKIKTEDISQITSSDCNLIQRAIEQRLVFDPLKYGFPLRWGLKGYRKLRVGDYRVIYQIINNEIRIIIIGHRKNIYKKVMSRL